MTTLMLWGGLTVSGGIGAAAASGRVATPMAAVAPSTSFIKDEHVTALSLSAHRSSTMTAPSLTERAIISRTQFGRAALAAGSSSTLGFLTRPYTTWHDITSVFDHCNPDYSTDGKVCEFDGSVGLRSNGVDPSFSLGYAQTPGGSDYLYYDGHNGWDYALAYENVLASADGTVALAGTDPVNTCFGQNVVINHPNGYSTRYAHLSQIYVSPGQSVARGQVIGLSGNTGCSSGAHLHFGVYVTSSWTAVDPWGWWGAAGADPWPSDPGDLWLTGTAQFPVPGAPSNVSAVAGNASATVSWTAPAFDGGTGNTNYLIVASPGGAQVSAFGYATSAVLPGLTNGTSYTFTVTAVNSVGSAQSAASNAVTPSGAIGRYRALTPARLLDTRTGLGGFSQMGTASSIDLALAGHAGLPTSGVAGVVLNVTATHGTLPSYLSVYPTGISRPATSSVNFSPGTTVANLVEVGVGAGGSISLYNDAGSVDVIIDVEGWYSADTTSPQGQFVPLSSTRLLDTRAGLGAVRAQVGANHSIDLQVAGLAGIPTSGAAAVVVNLTVANGTTTGFVSAYPTGSGFTSTSNVNYVRAQAVANRAVVQLGAGGKITLYNCCGAADLIADVSGWFTDGSNASLTGGTFYGVDPSRIVDTRGGLGGVQGPVGAGATAFSIAGLGHVPASPRAVIANVTITNATAGGYRTVYPNGAAQPPTSDLNVLAGTNTANVVILPLGSDGKIAVFSPQGASDVIVDVLGYYQ